MPAGQKAKLRDERSLNSILTLCVEKSQIGLIAAESTIRSIELFYLLAF